MEVLRHCALLLLSASVGAVTFPGGIFEPCLDPNSTSPTCYATRCIHLYTVPEQYSCEVTVYPKYDYDPSGRQCARPECVCAPGYFGGSCRPHVRHDCLQHNCTRNNASSYGPTRVHPHEDTTFLIHGVGLHTWPGYDSAKVVAGSTCSPNSTAGEMLAPGTNESTDLGPGFEERASVAHYTTHFDQPGVYTFCYREHHWEYHRVAPDLTVAGATRYDTADGDFARSGLQTRLRFYGFGLDPLDRLMLVSANDTDAYEAAHGWPINRTCDLNASFQATPVPVNASHSYSDVIFIGEHNYTVCYRARGGPFRDLGVVEVGHVPQYYELVYSRPEAGGRLLQSALNISLGGSALGSHVGAGGDLVELRTASRVYDEALDAVSWSWDPCGDPGPTHSSSALMGDGQSWAHSEYALWEVTLAAPLNATYVCYYSWRYGRWLPIPPRAPTDRLEVRELWLHGFDAPQPSCLHGWTTVSGASPECSADFAPEVPALYAQNNSMQVAPMSAVSYTLPTGTLSPDKFQFWVKPTCTDSSSARVILQDGSGHRVLEWHMGCPMITINHRPTNVDWAMQRNADLSWGTRRDAPSGYYADAWHKVTFHFQMDIKKYNAFFDDQSVQVDGARLHSFLDTSANGLHTLIIENDNTACPFLIDHLRMYNCFQTVRQNAVKSRVVAYDLLADIPVHLLQMAAGGSVSSISGNTDEQSQLTVETCLAED